MAPVNLEIATRPAGGDLPIRGFRDAHLVGRTATDTVIFRLGDQLFSGHTAVQEIMRLRGIQQEGYKNDGEALESRVDTLMLLRDRAEAFANSPDINWVRA